MYDNVFGERVSRARWKEMVTAFRNRQELIAAGLMNRRDLLKLGLLTGAGMLVAKRGLSARAQGAFSSSSYPNNQCASPATTPWTMPLPIMPIKQTVATALNPAPQIAPNTAINPATHIAYEGRTRNHQAPAKGFPFPAPRIYQVTQQAGTVRMSNELPLQPIWGFDGISPGPTYVASYGTPVLVRNVNNLPSNNGGFGINSVSTHLHSGHTPSESDGFPCDYFALGQYYDQYYPNVLAGFSSGFAPTGDIREAMCTQWYHDHRVGFTAQNVYKGLAGFSLLFNQYDTGNETTGFRLPTFPDYDIPMMFTDKCFDPTTAILAFDSFNLDGVLGDKFLVNGVIQPVLHVRPRRYRFRWLNAGVSRFYQIYLTDLTNPSANNRFWQIGNDASLLPKPILVPAVALGNAERADVIVDFTALAGKTLYLENRLEQTSGRGPTGNVLSPGQGNLLLKIVVDLPSVADNSVNPATGPSYYALPNTTDPVRVQRSFDFDQTYNGEWTINDGLMNCNTVRFTAQLNTAETWNLSNGRRDWSHPIHVHGEQFQVTQGAPELYSGGSSYNRDGSWGGGGWGGGSVPSGVNAARKDTVRLVPSGNVTVYHRFRDWTGRYVMHCHNLTHEDHGMMLRFDIEASGDTRSRP